MEAIKKLGEVLFAMGMCAALVVGVILAVTLLEAILRLLFRG